MGQEDILSAECVNSLSRRGDRNPSPGPATAGPGGRGPSAEAVPDGGEPELAGPHREPGGGRELDGVALGAAHERLGRAEGERQAPDVGVGVLGAGEQVVGELVQRDEQLVRRVVAGSCPVGRGVTGD